MDFKYKDTALLDQEQIISVANNLIPEITRIKEEIKKGFETPYAFMNLINDLDNLSFIKRLVEEKLLLNPTMLIIVAIGGSNLGSLAVMEFIYGKFYNETRNLKVYFADTTDTDYISDILNLAKQKLELGLNIILNIVSKSGTTIETVANFEIFFDLLKKHKSNDFNKYVVVTTQKNSLLWNFGKEINCSILEIPPQVGGRFSVLSSVGLFAFELLSIDSQEIIRGAKYILNSCFDNKNVTNNVAAISASILYIHYKQNDVKINDMFLFGNDLQALGNWYRQLLGESIGKEFNIKNEKVDAGITPTISIGSTDLHSVGQLYLVGQKGKFTTFVDILKNKTETKISTQRCPQVSPNIGNIYLSKIMSSIIDGVKVAYVKKRIPFCSITLDQKSEFEIGQFLQFKMMETIFLAYLMDINPFDQPNVELYKQETKNILNKIGSQI